MKRALLVIMLLSTISCTGVQNVYSDIEEYVYKHTGIEDNYHKQTRLSKERKEKLANEKSKKQALCDFLNNKYSNRDRLQPIDDWYFEIAKEYIKSQYKSIEEKAEDTLDVIKQSNIKTKNELYSIYREINRDCDPRNNLNIKNLAGEIKLKYYFEEEASFHKCTAGKRLSRTGLENFTYQLATKTPEKNCIYELAPGYVKVLQTTSDGVIASFFMSGRSIFIKTSHKYVDGDKLKPGFYEYTGVFDYITVLGSNKKIHKFKEVNIDNKCFKNLRFYDGYS